MTDPEFRRCPIRGHRTIIAPNRGQRPLVTEFSTSDQLERVDREPDPFLAGNEDQATAELLTIPRDGAWSVRVVENLYPALSLEVKSHNSHHDLFRSELAVGQQEVIVECPHFETELANLPTTQLADVLSAWQHRLKTIQTEGRFDYAFIFKNSGAQAGTSLPHTHSQLIATRQVPDAIQHETQAAREYFLSTGTPLQDAVVSAERDADRVILSQSGFTAFCPFASRFAFETCIAPTGAVAFRDLSVNAIANLSSVLHGTLRALQTEQPGAAYNLLLHTTPFSVAKQPWYRWRLELCPRLAQLAGFELGTGWFVNSVRPIDAAMRLRRHVAG